MTNFEIRAWIILQLMRVLQVKMSDLRDSYPYNPYSIQELDEWWNGEKKNGS